MGPPLVTRWVSNLLVVHIISDCLWKLNHALEVGQLYRSSDVRLTISSVAQQYTENTIHWL